MSFVQNFPFFTIILSLVCAVSSFVLKKNIALKARFLIHLCHRPRFQLNV